ncbi:MAG: hypothetical protein EOP11_12855 [Proteobacteria bacterium]|nr:MAG: hypothetical protein EOP11_12855 [Pseudomonadota bacterium]
MKILFALALILASSPAYALVRPLFWNELDQGRTLSLRQEIRLSDKVVIPAGTEMVITMREALSGPGMSLMYYGAREINCTHPEWQEGLELVLPEGELDASRAVGIELGKNCQWGVYVETKDLDSATIFNP